jgi:uncharacterized phage protein gp47/JayE
MSTGVTPVGFVAPTVQDILADIEADELTNIDAQLDTSPEEPIGQLNGIMAEKLAELWELGGVAYNSLSRDNAEGPQLDNIGTLTGSKRLTATPSVALECTLVFSMTGVYESGTLTANVSGQPDVQFTNRDDITVTGTTPVTVSNAVFICTQTGPTVANATTLNNIAVPVTGWTSISNAVDATLGTDEETDTAYRLRQDQELSAEGASTWAAMQGDLLEVAGVIDAAVLTNDTDHINGIGDIPHSYHAVIWDGPSPLAANADIAQTLFNDQPSGIPGNGNLSGVATDQNGNTYDMVFDRATQALLYFSFTCTLATGVTASTIAPLVKAAVVAYTNTNLGLGSEVVALAIRAIALTIPGVIDVPTFTLGLSPSPAGTANLFFTKLVIPLGDTSRIVVNGL